MRIYKIKNNNYMRAKIVNESLNEVLGRSGRSNIFISEYEKFFGNSPNFFKVTMNDMKKSGGFDDFENGENQAVLSSPKFAHYGTWNRWAQDEEDGSADDFDDFEVMLKRKLKLSQIAPDVYFDKDKQVGKYLADEYAKYDTWFFGN